MLVSSLMEGDKVIENGSIIINGNRIEAIGDASTISIPDSAKVYDPAGKTIMPGMVFNMHISAPSLWVHTTKPAFIC
jgi:imidazolonepropionase-like amidohydrolase